ncbi:hypothetical protein LJC60_04380 [Ruminococcaceae bacterium OttesenSCG-928-D13]|nr:hypothetical protein [Ruminococcaceae bacterium OttesenSCG-928-D13]
MNNQHDVSSKFDSPFVPPLLDFIGAGQVKYHDESDWNSHFDVLSQLGHCPDAKALLKQMRQDGLRWSEIEEMLNEHGDGDLRIGMEVILEENAYYDNCNR